MKRIFYFMTAEAPRDPELGPRVQKEEAKLQYDSKLTSNQ
jgi:hypothetical protein